MCEKGREAEAFSFLEVKEKRSLKNVTKIILFVILIKNGFFCVRKLQKEVQKDRKTYAPRSTF